ncbi:hypothetical protein FDB15_17400 [Clostridium botulinum]|nr:hypothetical protein [Clostridium botulinum]NFI64803.1 hypothetical protein [Clostridium botulinum]NFJ45412.1 hypothetical protein [Clostridium botulinum]NFJ49080.1 hypothetical protein [Clostridium botulinum]NFK26964.1 hypothetical protein [Clostridium botulinum]
MKSDFTGLVDNKGISFEDNIRNFKIKSIQNTENEVKIKIFYEKQHFNEFICKLANSFCEKYKVESIVIEEKISRILNKGQIKYFYLKPKGYKTVISIYKNFLNGEIYKNNEKNIIDKYKKESVEILKGFLDTNMEDIIYQLSQYYKWEYYKVEVNGKVEEH